MAHKHARLMAQYAEDAFACDEPHKLWQYKLPLNDKWINFEENNPRWEIDYEYRRKPRTIRIGEFDVPEPMRDDPQNGQEYYIPDVYDLLLPWRISAWSNMACDRELLQNGTCHATKEAAILHAAALISLTCTPERLADLKKLL